MLRRYLTVALSLGIFILAMMAGWGFRDWREYFSNPERAGVVVLALLGAVIVVSLGLDFDVLRAGQSEVGHQSVLLFLLTVASIVLIWFLPDADRKQILTMDHARVSRIVGLALCALGIIVRLLGLAKLGKQFSAYVTLQEGHELVQTGIYRVIRHPLYLSLLLLGPGFALVFRSLLVLPILVITAAFISTRIYQEERLLRKEFGSAFDEYRNRTWMLIPFIF